MNQYALIFLFASSFLIACDASKKPNETIEEVNTITTVEDITFGSVTEKLLSDHIDCTGQIEVPPSDKASLYAPVGGILKNLEVIPGNYVKKGQVLATLQDLAIVELQQDYLRSVSVFQLAEQDYQRKKELYEKDVIAKSEYQEALSIFEMAKSEVNGHEVQLQLLGLSAQKIKTGGIVNKIYLRSPITGYITSVSVNTSMYVDGLTEILTVINPGHKHVELEVFAKDITQVKEEQRVTFKIPGSVKVYEAEVFLLGQQVDEANRTVSVHAHMHDDGESLVVGTRLTATIYGEPSPVFTLPNGAIINSDGKKKVLIKDGNSLTPIIVETGRSFDNETEILNEEVLNDKKIVIKDAYYYFN